MERVREGRDSERERERWRTGKLGEEEIERVFFPALVAAPAECLGRPLRTGRRFLNVI